MIDPTVPVLAGFDLEATGVDPTTARILEAALVVEGLAAAVGPASYVRYVDPGADVEIPPIVTEITGISRQTLDKRGADPTAVAVATLAGLLRDFADREIPLVVMNATYDLTLLGAEAARQGVTIVWPPVIDPLVLDRAVDRYRRGKRTLTALAAHYDVPLDRAHTAEADVLAAIGVARAILDRNPDLAGMDPADLHRFQQDAHRVWADGYNAWARVNAPDRTPASADWPGVPHPLDREG